MKQKELKSTTMLMHINFKKMAGKHLCAHDGMKDSHSLVTVVSNNTKCHPLGHGNNNNSNLFLHSVYRIYSKNKKI